MSNRKEFIQTAGAALAVFALSPLSAFAIDWRNLSDAEWHKRLNAQQYDVLRRAGTEAPYTSALLTEHRHGKFACGACELALFKSETKFDSHTGWPSFYRALPHALVTREDTGLPGEARTEVRCSRCLSHIGHVFNDGPQPTGLRYCMNGIAMVFKANS
jgi:peptide-methionine (R)-S-oxide reductase